MKEQNEKKILRKTESLKENQIKMSEILEEIHKHSSNHVIIQKTSNTIKIIDILEDSKKWFFCSITVHEDHSICLWNHAGVRITTLFGHHNDINSLAVDHKLKKNKKEARCDLQMFFYTASSDHTIRKWIIYFIPESDNQDNIRKFPHSYIFNKHESIVFAKHYQEVSCIQIFDEDKQKKMMELIKRRSLISTSFDRSIKIWNRTRVKDDNDGKEIFSNIAHNAPIYLMVISKDKQYIYSIGYDKKICLWNYYLDEGKPQLKNVSNVTYNIKDDFIYLLIHKEGNKLYAGTEKGEIYLWDTTVNPSALIPCLDSHHKISEIKYIYSEKNEYFVSGSPNGEIRLWRVSDKKELGRLHAHEGNVTSLFSYSPSNFSSTTQSISKTPSLTSINPIPFMDYWVYSSGEDKTLKKWNLTSLMPENLEHTKTMTSLSIDPEEIHFISSGYDGKIIIQGIQNESKFTLDHGNPVLFVKMLDKNMVLAVEPGFLRIWNISKNSDKKLNLEIKAEITSVCIDEPEKNFEFILILIGLKNGYLEKYSLTSIENDPKIHLDQHILKESDIVKSAIFFESSKRKRIATVVIDESFLKIYDIEKNKITHNVSGHKDNIEFIISGKKNQIISGSKDKTIRIWNILEEEESYSSKIIQIHSLPIIALAISGNKDYAVSGDEETIFVWLNNDGSNEVISKIQANSGILKVLAITNLDEKSRKLWVFTGSIDGNIRKWPLSYGQSLWKKEPVHSSIIRCLRITRKSDEQPEYVITGSTDGTIKIWSLLNPKHISTIKVETTKLEVTPDGNTLIACSPEKIMFYDIKNKTSPIDISKDIQQIKDHSPQTISLTENGQSLFSAGQKGEIWCWDVVNKKPLYKLGKKEIIDQSQSRIEDIISSVNNYVILGDISGQIRICDIVKNEFIIEKKPENLDTSVICMAAKTNKNNDYYIFASYMDCYIRVWKFDSFDLTLLIEIDTDIKALLKPDITISYKTEITIPFESDLIAPFKSMIFLSKNNLLICGSFDSKICVFEFKEKENEKSDLRKLQIIPDIKKEEKNQNEPSNLDEKNTKKNIKKNKKHQKDPSKDIINEVDPEVFDDEAELNKKHISAIFSMDLNSDETILVSAGQDRRMIYWEIKNNELVFLSRKEGESQHQYTCFSFFSKDTMLVLGGDDKKIRLWENQPQEQNHYDYVPKRNWIAHSETLTYLFLVSKIKGSEKEYIFSGSEDKYIKIWCVKGELKFQIDTKIIVNGFVTLCGLKDNLQKIIFVGNDPKIYVYKQEGLNKNAKSENDKKNKDDKSEKQFKIHFYEDSEFENWRAHSKTIKLVALTPEYNANLKLISASEDGTLRVWNVAKRILLRTFDNINTVQCPIFLTTNGRICLIDDSIFDLYHGIKLSICKYNLNPNKIQSIYSKTKGFVTLESNGEILSHNECALHYMKNFFQEDTFLHLWLKNPKYMKDYYLKQKNSLSPFFFTDLHFIFTFYENQTKLEDYINELPDFKLISFLKEDVLGMNCINLVKDNKNKLYELFNAIFQVMEKETTDFYDKMLFYQYELINDHNSENDDGEKKTNKKAPTPTPPKKKNLHDKEAPPIYEILNTLMDLYGEDCFLIQKILEHSFVKISNELYDEIFEDSELKRPIYKIFDNVFHITNEKIKEIVKKENEKSKNLNNSKHSFIRVKVILLPYLTDTTYPGDSKIL